MCAVQHQVREVSRIVPANLRPEMYLGNSDNTRKAESAKKLNSMFYGVQLHSEDKIACLKINKT